MVSGMRSLYVGGVLHCTYLLNCFLNKFLPSPQTNELPPIKNIRNAAVLLNLGDSVTTDHISPAGSISRNSSAARYLAARG